MADDALDVLFAHGVKNALATALFDNPQGRLRRILDGRLHAPRPGNVCERLAGQRGVESAAGELHVLRITATALIADHHDGTGLDLLARRPILQSRSDLLTPAFQC